jgi:C4-dicarboxylate transporter/malic acid transport protein
MRTHSSPEYLTAERDWFRDASGATVQCMKTVDLRSFGPNWFAAVMGTGILANAAALLPFDQPALKQLAIGPWLLAAALLILVLVATAAQWLVHPDRARAHIHDPAMAPFFGCPPMALLTVGAGTLLVGTPLVGAHAAVVVDSALWSIGTALGLLTMVVVPTMMIRRRDLDPRQAFATWLLPVVPPTVSATTGAALIPHLPSAGAQEAMLLGCYAILGAALALSALTIGLLWFRLIFVDRGPARMVPTLWLVLGPLGQSVTAFGLLGPHAGELLKAPYGEALQALGVVYGVPVWGFAMTWLVIAGALTLRELRRGLPFSLTWWSFTFPVGTVVTATAGLEVQTGAMAFTWLAACTFALLLVAWAAAFANTLKGVWSGALLPPPVATSPA